MRFLPKTVLLVSLISFAALGRTHGARAEDDAATQLRKCAGVTAFPATGTKINRVVVRGALLDEKLMALLLRVEGLATLELNGTPIADDAWAQFPQLRTLKNFSITDVAVANEKIQTLQTALPALKLAYRWSVSLDHPDCSLTVSLPSVRVIYRDLKPVKLEKEQAPVDLLHKNRSFADVVIEPRWSRSRQQDGTFDRVRGAGDYVLEDGLYTFLIGGRWFRISHDGTTLTVDGRSYPIFGPQQTVIVNKEGRTRNGPPIEARFWPFPDPPRPGFEAPSFKMDWDLTLKSEPVEPPPATSKTRAPEAKPVVPLVPDRDERNLAWTFGTFADQPWIVAHICPLGTAKGNVDAETMTAEDRWNAHKDRGVTLVFELGPPNKWVRVKGQMNPIMHFLTCKREVQSGRDRWTMSNIRWRNPGKPEKLRANCFVDQGEMSFGFGSGAKDADFRVRTDGTAITIGEKTIELTPGRVTTVVLSGDKIKGEKVELVSVEKPK